MDKKTPGGLLLFNQDLLHEVHKYVVKEYVTQVIKPRWKMNRETRQQVSRKMSLEASIIHNTLIDQVCELSPGFPTPRGAIFPLGFTETRQQALEEDKPQEI